MSDNEQMNKNFNTVADVVAMVRRAAQYYEGEAEKSKDLLRESFELSAANYREIANLVEAAWKRERETIEANALSVGGIVEAARHKPVGNAAAMREELLNIQEYADAMDVDDGNVLAILDSCRDALAAPARNCDVGTAEEQEERLVEFCDSTDCGRCPHNRVGMDFRGCTLTWAQSHYESDKKGDGDGM